MRSSRVVGAAALVIVLAAGRAHAQTDDQVICPLSEGQQSNSQSAWAELAAIFKHDRCSNCHGKKNPFEEDTTHPDRMTIELDEKGEFSEAKTFEACQTCHDQTPANAPWKIPPPIMRWWNQSVEELCRTQHKLKPPFIFIRHSENDPLIQEAFRGTMALNDVGRDIVESEPYPDPPPMGHSEFIEQIRSWLDAQDLTEDSPKWQGDQVECGCVPQAYEMVIDVTFSSSGLFAGCSGDAHISETVPIDARRRGDTPRTRYGRGRHQHTKHALDECERHREEACETITACPCFATS